MNAAIVNVLNPNPYLGWSLVMGPLFLHAWQEVPRNAAALLVGFYTTSGEPCLGVLPAAGEEEFHSVSALIGINVDQLHNPI